MDLAVDHNTEGQIESGFMSKKLDHNVTYTCQRHLFIYSFIY